MDLAALAARLLAHERARCSPEEAEELRQAIAALDGIQRTDLLEGIFDRLVAEVPAYVAREQAISPMLRHDKSGAAVLEALCRFSRHAGAQDEPRRALWHRYVEKWLKHNDWRDAAGLAEMLDHWAAVDPRFDEAALLKKLTGKAARFVRFNGPSADLRRVLTALAGRLREARGGSDAAAKAILKDIDGVLDDAPLVRLVNSDFKASLAAEIAAAAAPIEAWRDVIDLAYAAQAALELRPPSYGDSTSPESEAAITDWRPDLSDMEAVAPAALARARFGEVFPAALRAYVPKRGGADRNIPAIKGMILLCAAASPVALAPLLGAFVPRCFKGAKAHEAQTAEAALFALANMGPPGLEQLALLNGRIKHQHAAEILHALLRRAARQVGVPLAVFEEGGLPDFGLDRDGRKQVAFGDAVAIIETDGRELRLQWHGAGGKPRREAPAAVKRHHAAALKELNAEVKTIKSALQSAAQKLERLYLSGKRARPFAHWRACFAEHPLMRAPTTRLIWRIQDGPSPLRDGLWREDGFEDVTGARIDLPATDAAIELWHPLDATADAVAAWRDRIETLALRQPFKQAHREVYKLTEAERQTATYSIRFAAHILLQHQFDALTGIKNWKFGYHGNWDSDRACAERLLPAWGLAAQLFVAFVPGEYASSGVALYVVSDQLRFIRGDVAVPLQDVPPLVRSEVMRDVDLFVSGASIGNDPEWVDADDRPREERFSRYWQDYAFGNLSNGVAADARRDILARLLPRLAIAEQCRLDARFLHVEGKLNRYRIHLGSGHVVIEASGRHLCIMPRLQSEPALALPFEGDRILSIILSKALMLANDDGIEDPIILSQIRCGPATPPHRPLA